MSLEIVPYFPTSKRFIWSDDLKAAADCSEEVSKIVAGHMNMHRRVDIVAATKGLVQVGQLLQLAIAGSRESPCSIQVVQLSGKYQRLVGDTVNTTNTFIGTTLDALQKHQLALTLLEKEDSDRALKLIEACSAEARKMADASAARVKDATELCDLAADGLSTAIKENVVAGEKRKELMGRVSELQALSARRKEESRGLEDEIEKLTLEREKAFEDENVVELFGVLKSIAGAVAGVAAGVTEGAGGVIARAFLAITGAGRGDSESKAEEENPQRVTLRESQASIIELRKSILADKELLARKSIQAEREGDEEKKTELLADIASMKVRVEENEKLSEELNKQIREALASLGRKAEIRSEELTHSLHGARAAQREADASLAEVVTRIQLCNTENNDLEAAIASLELTAKMLGKIQTIFESTRLYWMGMERHCDSLVDIGNIQLLSGTTDLFREQVKHSALSWLALGRVNVLALEGIEEARLKINAVISDLPSRAEARELVNSVSVMVLEDLKEDSGDTE